MLLCRVLSVPRPYPTSTGADSPAIPCCDLSSPTPWPSTLLSSYPCTLHPGPPVEPEAPQRGQNPLLQEGDPAVVQLHDDREG